MRCWGRQTRCRPRRAARPSRQGTRRKNRCTSATGSRCRSDCEADKDDDAGVRRRLGHRLQVVVTALVERNSDRCQAGHPGEDRIPVESRLAEHNPITGPRHRMQNLHHHPARTRSQHDLLVADPDVTGDQAAQPFGQEFRIPVGDIDRADQCRAHRRQRRKRVLVERQCEWIGRVRQRVEDLRGPGLAASRGSISFVRPSGPPPHPRSRRRARKRPSSRRRRP